MLTETSGTPTANRTDSLRKTIKENSKDEEKTKIDSAEYGTEMFHVFNEGFFPSETFESPCTSQLQQYFTAMTPNAI
uniref:Uncharacterized protein n=1 Tax=Ascaris lumbricoides TaxID=6252 RepID=A0A0M3IE55_ASCLU